MTAAARRVVEAATTSRRCWTLVASEQSPPNGGGSSHPGWPGKCPRGVRPAGCPGRAVLAPPLAPGALGQSPTAGGAALGEPVCLFVFRCHVCAPAQLLAVCSWGPGCVCVCACVMCVSFSVCLRWGAVCQSICPLVSVYIYCVCFCVLCGFKGVYLPVCMCISQDRCLGGCLPVPQSTRSCVYV